MENRLLDACRTFPEEIWEISSFFTTQFPVLTSQNDLESVNFFKEKAIQPRICVVKMEIDQGKKKLVSRKLLCSKMQISWYKSDRWCSNEGSEFEKDQNYLTHLVVCSNFDSNHFEVVIHVGHLLRSSERAMGPPFPLNIFPCTPQPLNHKLWSQTPKPSTPIPKPSTLICNPTPHTNPNPSDPNHRLAP